MARIQGADAIYQVADEFRSRCLAAGLSLLWPNDRVWTPENITTLRDAFENRVEVSGGFYAMLEAQLQGLSDDIHKVAIDAIAFYQLPISRPTRPDTK